MIRFKSPEVLFHMAALGQKGASGNELDNQDTDGAPDHGVCVHCSNKTNI